MSGVVFSAEVVSRCESYAGELFGGEDQFTQVTKWQDGDFKVLVWHGKGHDESPYRSRAEKITYRHHDGLIVYADFTHRIDHHTDVYHESRVLERYSAEVTS
jgi:hypothetical protein